MIALNPQERTERHAFRPSQVALLIDTSMSMQQPEVDPWVKRATPTRSRTEAVKDTLESDLVGAALLEFMDGRDGDRWQGSCAQLLELLEQSVSDGVKRSSAWPKTPKSLSNRLRRLMTFFRESGTHIEFHKATRGIRLVTIARAAPNNTATIASSATRQSVASLNQTVTDHSISGGRSLKVAVADSAANQPPLELADSKSFGVSPKESREAEEAEEAVDCQVVLESSPPLSQAADGIGFCLRCGPVEPRLMDQTWTCPSCLEPCPG